MTSLLRRIFLPVIWWALLGTAAAAAAPPTRASLIGAWRLVGIDYRGPHGRLEDPFYHRGSTGLLVYDESGMMSVQIAGANRAVTRVPAARPEAPAATGDDARARAAAFDSYYAYFGTWEFDAAGATVVHHVERALIPSEDGVSYSQQVGFEDGRLVMTNRHRESDGEYVRTKTWERIGGAALP
jgi:hypothetical protein